MAFSSEATKVGMIPPEGLTEEEHQKWLTENIDPDMMGFDGKEGSDDDDQ